VLCSGYTIICICAIDSPLVGNAERFVIGVGGIAAGLHRRAAAGDARLQQERRRQPASDVHSQEGPAVKSTLAAVFVLFAASVNDAAKGAAPHPTVVVRWNPGAAAGGPRDADAAAADGAPAGDPPYVHLTYRTAVHIPSTFVTVVVRLFFVFARL
jgi:phosphate/sulfate permease